MQRAQSYRKLSKASIVIAFIAALGLVLAACSSSEPEAQGPLTADQVTITGSGTSLKAEFPIPSNATELSTNDVTEGSGTAIKVGDSAMVSYWLFSGSTGSQLDTNSSTPEGSNFPLTEGSLIPGFLQGVVGMKPGSERVIVVPPALGYGPSGQGPIPANETLVFVVKINSVS